jgi:SRSO17 transposase
VPQGVYHVPVVDDIAAEDVSSWKSGLDDAFALVAGVFRTASVRWRARAYLTGLLAPIERKTAWQLSEAAGDPNPDGVQYFLDRAVWSADALRDVVRSYAAEHFAGPDGVLVVDETGFVKKGRRSAGVQSQYSGTAGLVETCQLGVLLAYAASTGRALIDRELYLPESGGS